MQHGISTGMHLNLILAWLVPVPTRAFKLVKSYATEDWFDSPDKDTAPGREKQHTGVPDPFSIAALWRSHLDKRPPYLAGADVVVSVVQAGDYRDFVWDADWSGIFTVTASLGRMSCRLSEGERHQLEHAHSQNWGVVFPEDLTQSPRGEGQINNTTGAHEGGPRDWPCRLDEPEDTLGGVAILQQMASAVLAVGAKRIAMVGLGPGAMPTYWQRFVPQVKQITAIELSPMTVNVAKQFFGLRPDDRLEVIAQDGLEWLQNTSEFDVFVHDASGALHYFLSPSSLRLIRNRTNDGVLVVNTFGMPWWARPFGIIYFRGFFAEVHACGPIVVASWTRFAKRKLLSRDRLPDHAKYWLGPEENWEVYYAIGRLEVLLWVLAVTSILGTFMGCHNALYTPAAVSRKYSLSFPDNFVNYTRPRKKTARGSLERHAEHRKDDLAAHLEPKPLPVPGASAAAQSAAAAAATVTASAVQSDGAPER